MYMLKLYVLILNRVGLMSLVAILRILGERPSSPVDFLVPRDSRALTNSGNFIKGILNFIFRWEL